eukprot:5308859-Pleurochrysis_carterae.AAC.1
MVTVRQRGRHSSTKVGLPLWHWRSRRRQGDQDWGARGSLRDGHSRGDEEWTREGGGRARTAGMQEDGPVSEVVRRAGVYVCQADWTGGQRDRREVGDRLARRRGAAILWGQRGSRAGMTVKQLDGWLRESWMWSKQGNGTGATGRQAEGRAKAAGRHTGHVGGSVSVEGRPTSPARRPADGHGRVAAWRMP